ncbi:hypothetical protein ES708_12421 [subsurface metagenome]
MTTRTANAIITEALTLLNSKIKTPRQLLRLQELALELEKTLRKERGEK